MARSILRPVTCVIDSLRSTFFSSLTPSGVSSNAQANNNATGKATTQEQENETTNPIGQRQHRHEDIDDLQQQPGNDDVRDRDTKHIAALKLVK